MKPISSFGFLLLVSLFLCNNAEAIDFPYIRMEIFATFEETIQQCSLIVVGEVIDVSEKDNTTKSIIRIDEAVYPLDFEQKEINVFTSANQYDDNGYFKYWNLIQFRPGEKVLLFLKSETDGGYSPIYEMYGKFLIVDGEVFGSRCKVEDYIEEIKKIKNTNRLFRYYIPPYYKPIQQVSANKSSSTKAILISGVHFSDFEFSGDPSLMSGNTLSFEWDINPAGALRDSVRSLYYSDIRPICVTAASSWSNIADANLSFSIGDSTSAGSSYDGQSTICWEPLNFAGATITYHSATEFDIKISTNDSQGHDRYWILPGDQPIDYGSSLLRTVVHEMGHTILDDLTSPSESDQLMYHVSGGTVDSPRNGDKAGAVWVRPNISGTLDFNQLWGWYQGWPALNADVTINTHVTMMDMVDFNSGVDITVTGTLFLDSGVDLDEAVSGNGWGGINLNTGGAIEYNTDPSILNAYRGIEFFGGSISFTGINPTSHKIDVWQSSNAGIRIYNCSPTIEQIRIIDTEPGYGGIYVDGSSSSPIIHDCNSSSGSRGITIGSYASLDLFLTKIDGNSDDAIDLGIQSYLYMDGDNGYGHNTIDPTDGQLAIYNRSTSGQVSAENNWWGQVPTDALFGYPASVDYTPYLGSAYSGVGVAPKVVSNTSYFNQGMIQEKEKLWNNAIYIYEYIINDVATTESDRIRAAKNLLRVYEQSGMDYSELKEFFHVKLAGHQSVDLYHAYLEILITEIDIRQGNYFVAVGDLEEKAEKYSGTSLEVELLARAADVSGRLMNNKSRAEQYARRAAAINPGQGCLMSAFEAAGITYNPMEYADKYENEELQFNTWEEKHPVVTQFEEYVEVFPNPANPISNISYSISNSSHVMLAIYSITGQKVATVVDDYRDAGLHKATFDGSNLASGLYFYRFQSDSFSTTGKMMILK